MKLKQHDKLKETLKSDSNWEDYYEEIKPLLGLRELGFTRIFEYLNNIKDYSYIICTQQGASF